MGPRTRAHGRGWTSLLLVGAMVTGLSAVPAGAQDPAGVVDREFAAEVLGDPWDFANPEDAPLVRGPPVSLNVTDAGFRDGTFEFTSDVGFFDLHPLTVPGALPDSRDGRWNPIDADTFTHVSLRLHASRQQAFRIGWFDCGHDYTGCFHFHDFQVPAGWSTQSFDMTRVSADWRGQLQGLRLASGAGSTTFRLDWVRVHTAGSPVAPVDGAPQPRVLEPDAEGGEDFATTVLGNPWDFGDASDVVATGNVTDGRFADGRFHGTNGAPTQNDPWVQLSHGPGIDPERYHRLTVETTYDGPFSLEDAPGGGMHGRMLFRRADFGPAWIDGRELVTYPSRPRVTYDLKDGRFGSTVEAGNRSWTGSTVTGLRWDPNEDRGPRRWRVDEIRLAAPDEASATVDVVWEDPAHVDGTTVDVGISRTRGDVTGRALVTGVRQRAGENRVRLDLSEHPRGSWWVWVRATSPSGVMVASTAGGELVVTGRVAGPDRIATAIGLSELGWPGGATTAVVASARAFPDALAGVQLADAVHGPLLLVEPGSLSPAVRTELRRLGVEEVLVLGGTSAVAPAVTTAIEDALPAAAVRRVAGPDRFATAARIAAEAERRWRAAGRDVADDVLLASGTSFPDALAAGPLVAATRTPLLLTAPTLLPDATRDALRARDGGEVVVVGGDAAVSPAVADATGRPVRRIAGPDRYETARRLAAAAVDAGAHPGRALVASGEQFPDALGAGAFAARTGEVLVLTGSGLSPAATEDWVARPDVGRALVVGGRMAVLEPVVDRLHRLARD